MITDRTQARRPLVEVIEAALEGGCRWVSLREKDLSTNERLALVDEVLPLVRRFGATLLVHRDVNAAVRADGVHLPAGSDVLAARARLGENAWIGLSCHTLDEVRAAKDTDYVTLGPFAPTASKPGYLPVLGPEAIREAARYGLPVLALGGVDETNLGAFKRAGAAGAAVMGGVMRADDPRARVRRLIAAWDEA